MLSNKGKGREKSNDLLSCPFFMFSVHAITKEKAIFKKEGKKDPLEKP